MKDKYIEEEFPLYTIFGEYGDGCVDVSTADGDDMVTHISREEAQRLIDNHNAAIKKLCEMAHAFAAAAEEDFIRFWYDPIRERNDIADKERDRKRCKVK